MNALEIVQKACKKVGYASPASFTGMSDDQEQVKGWLDDAYNELQLSHESFDFLEQRFQGPLATGKRIFTTTELNIPECRQILGDGYLLDFSTSRMISKVTHVDEDDIKYTILKEGEATKQPTRFSFSSSEIRFDSALDGNYRMFFEYYRAPFVMVAELDEPVFNSEYHNILYYGILEKYSVEDNDPELYQYAVGSYQKMFNRLLLQHGKCPIK